MKSIVSLASITMMLLALMFVNTPQSDYAISLQRVWLKYDDGSYEVADTWPEGYMLGVRFTPPKACLLRALSFYIVASPGIFEAHILNATSHEDLVAPLTIKPPREFVSGWLEVNLLRHRTWILIRSDFIVALKFISSYMPVIGSDSGGIDDGRSEIYDGTSWNAYPLNVMIRAEIIYLSRTSQIVDNNLEAIVTPD